MSEGNYLEGTAISEVVALTKNAAQPFTGEAIHFTVVPNDCTLKSLQDFQYPNGIRPDRIKADVKLADSGSFTRYVAAFADDRTRIFANPQQQSFLAVIDYHGVGDERKPEFLSHKANLQLAKDDRWNIWMSKNEKVFTQSEFAEFIEDNLSDIATPEPAFMLEVSRDLNAKVDVNFGSSVRLQNGQVKLQYQEEVKAGVGAGNVEVPESFTIRIPVFYGTDPVSITARLRFRIVSGKLTFHYKLYRPVETLNDAFNRVVASIGETLKTDVLLGTP